jgi:hypothetical protein
VKIIRYIAAFVGFLLGWVGTAILVGLLVAAVFPGPGIDHNVLGDWRSWPGSLLGVLVGYWIFQRVSGEFRRSDVR